MANLEETVTKMEEVMDNIPVYIVGFGDSTNGKLVYFKFKLNSSDDDYETGVTKANCLCKDGIRPKKMQIKSKEKLEDYLKEYPFGIGSQPCYARLVPMDQMKTDSNFVTSAGIQMIPKWFGANVWHGSPPTSIFNTCKTETREADIELQNMTGNPLNLEVEKLSNVPGKFFRRKRWRCRNGLGFVRFMYEGQVAIARMCGRDFFINGKSGSLPVINTNHEIDVTMEVRRLKKPGLWPQLDPINSASNDPDELVGTEFVSPAVWTGTRPSEAVLEEHLKNSEVDMFMMPKELVSRLKSLRDEDFDDEISESSVMVTDDATEEKCKVVKDAFPLPKDAIYFNQAAILIKFVSNFLIQLELRSSPTTEPLLVGKKVFVSRNRFYTTDGLVMKAKENFDNHVSVGHEIHCDIAPQAADDTTWVATIAWLGGINAKPDIEPLHWHHELNRKAQRGKILSLEAETDSGVSGGLIYNLDSGERAVFSRNDVYLFGTCLAKMDLTYVLALNDKVKLVSKPIEDPNELHSIKDKYGGLEIYRKATIVWVGETPRYVRPGEEESRFGVDKQLTGLLQYLNKRDIAIDFFIDFLVPGHMPPRNNDSDLNTSSGLSSLMTATDLRGQVVELKRPDCGNLKKDTVNGILKISSGELAGKLAFFPRHCLHLFGHNMYKANLMDVVLPREEFNVELVAGTNNKSVPYTVRAAWIGTRPNGPKEIGGINSPEFTTWLSQHKMTEAEFKMCVQGERPPKPFFPFTSEVHSGRIVALNSPDHKGIQAGILTITKGPLEKKNVIFEANSVFVHTVHFEHGDLAYILKEGDKVTVEVTEFSGGKERKRIFAKAKSAIEKLGFQPLPNHYAQLVYIGSRPKQERCCPLAPVGEAEVELTPNLKLWLAKRNLTCGFFSSLIQGLAPPKPQVDSTMAMATEEVPMEKNPFAVKMSVPYEFMEAPLEGPPNVPTEVVRETMAQTDAMIRRVMKCTSPEDVNIKDVISNDDEMQLAMFIAKSLASAISFYSMKTNKSKSSEPASLNPRPIAPPHVDPYSDYYHQPTLNQPDPPAFRPVTFDYGRGSSHRPPPPVSNFQNRGLCGLREPLLNYNSQDQRQRRRSGEQFRNSVVEPPFKRKFFQNNDRF